MLTKQVIAQDLDDLLDVYDYFLYIKDISHSVVFFSLRSFQINKDLTSIIILIIVSAY